MPISTIMLLNSASSSEMVLSLGVSTTFSDAMFASTSLGKVCSTAMDIEAIAISYLSLSLFAVNLCFYVRDRGVTLGVSSLNSFFATHWFKGTTEGGLNVLIDLNSFFMTIISTEDIPCCFWDRFIVKARKINLCLRHGFASRVSFPQGFS